MRKLHCLWRNLFVNRISWSLKHVLKLFFKNGLQQTWRLPKLFYMINAQCKLDSQIHVTLQVRVSDLIALLLLISCSSRSKGIEFLSQALIFNLFIQCRKPLIWQTMNSVGSNILSLKYSTVKPSDLKDLGIWHFNFVSKTHFL